MLRSGAKMTHSPPFAGRDPDARPPRNGRQRVLLKLYKFMQSLKSAEVVFALKYSFVSVALWVPQVVQASA